MSEEKATSTKQVTKKAVPVAEPAKPKKATAVPKAKSVAGEKAASRAPAAVAPAAAKAAGKAATAKSASKTVAGASGSAKPKMAAATPKATGAGKAAAAPASTKAVGKMASAGKAATAKPVEAKKKASATGKLIAKPAKPSLEERQRWVATAAYHRAEKRGFAPGYEVQDWLDAEAEVNELVGKG